MVEYLLSKNADIGVRNKVLCYFSPGFSAEDSNPIVANQQLLIYNYDASSECIDTKLILNLDIRQITLKQLT